MSREGGKLLWVDLTAGEISESRLEDEARRKFLGGSGLAAHLFFASKGYEADPLSPANPLLFLNGPLSGTNLPGCSRLAVCARSPLTGIWGESSMGGSLARQLRGSGYEGIFFTGASKRPVYLLLTERGGELRDASRLWGMGTFQAEEAVKAEVGDRRTAVACIGPAGEHLVKYASVVSNRGNLAARCGMGAVMGSKMLKAVAVRGDLGHRPADPGAYEAVRRKALENIRRSAFAEGLQLFGTAGGVDLSSAICDLPVKNWREPRWIQGMESLSGVNMADTILVARRSCYACPIACKRVVEIREGKYSMPQGPGPEYECVGSLGFMLKVGDLEAVARANALCNDYGMDVISTGGTLAYAVEAFREGLIDESITGGMVLDWGRPDLLIELIPRIARREGFGDELAEGSRHLSANYGGEDYAIQVKGLECPMHDPRALWSMALGYATSIRGGCHNRDTNLGLEMGMDSLEEIGFPATLPQRGEGKAQMTVHSQAIGAVCDSAVICLFAWKGAGSSLSMLRDMLNAVTGYGLDLEDLMETGNRIWYLKRALCNLCGTTREDDRVPRRIIEPHPDGEAQFLLGALNPLLRSTNRLLGRIENERVLRLLKEFNRRFTLRHTFRIVSLAGKILPAARASARAARASRSGEPGGGRVEFDPMLEEFYRLRGLDERGFPEAAVLERYGLEEIAKVLHAGSGAEARPSP